MREINLPRLVYEPDPNLPTYALYDQITGDLVARFEWVKIDGFAASMDVAGPETAAQPTVSLEFHSRAVADYASIDDESGPDGEILAAGAKINLVE